MTETTDTTAPALEVSPPLIVNPQPLPKLDLGCGQNPQPGFEGVDLYGDKATHRVDLFKFPWPFADNSVDEIFCSHFIEHIPAREITTADVDQYALVDGLPTATKNYERYLGQDMLLAFFDECHRILTPNGWIQLQWPALQSVRAFQDPTHRRYIPLQTIPYLDADWRKSLGLDHYPVRCNFKCSPSDVHNIADAMLNQFVPEVQARWIGQYWNTVLDHQAKLQAIK